MGFDSLEACAEQWNSACSVLLSEDAVVVGRHPPVLVRVVLVRVVLLVVREEVIQLDALSEVLVGLKASDVLEHIEVAVHVDTGPNQTLPVDALQLDVCVVLLELEGDRLVEVDVRSLYRVHVLPRHLELREVVVLWEHLHILFIKEIITTN